MSMTRREFGGGALAFALGAPIAGTAHAQPTGSLAAALQAIRSYGEAHLRHFGLPGMTLGLVAPGGFSTVIDFGYADLQARRPIAPDTLFQIGSVTKCMTAAVIHQLAAEGRVGLSERVSAVVPEVPLPSGNSITIQDLLDHTAGLPDSAPIFPDGGLWTAYPPRRHWYYSNTGYDILGKIAERRGGKPLAQLFAERIFVPLAMVRTRGAIAMADRSLYAQGYEAADAAAPFVRGTSLAPAGWIDSASGAGSVASTADDMNRFMRSLASAAQGRGGLGLSPPQATEFTSHAVPTDTPGTTYGNGLQHVREGARTYLHHTGGMVSFSSAMHMDVASGAGAFASSNITGFASYRPRLLTRFAVDALANATAGRPLPAPPSLGIAIANAGTYHGRYSGGSGVFEVRPGNPLTIVADGQSATLQPWGGEQFRTLHPRFRAFTLVFERSGNIVTRANWGPASFVREGSGAKPLATDAALARLAGRYVNDSPWWGTAQVVERGGKLWLGTDMPMTRIGDNQWRVGKESWSPERASFANFINGTPQTFIFSGEKFLRQDR